MDLLNKYKPTCYDDIIGNAKPINTLLKDLKKNKYKGCHLLVGQSGSCKTTLVELISKEKKWPIRNISIADINTRGDIDDNIICLFKKSIVKKILLIDDIDLATNVSGVRNPIESKLKKLKDIVNKDKFNLIFIVSTENKTAIFKHYRLKTYKFQKNRDTALEKFTKKIFKKEGITLSEKSGDKIISELVGNSQSNVRKLLLDIQSFIQSNSNKSVIKYTSINKKIMDSSQKDKTYKDIYDLMGDIFKSVDMKDNDSIIDRESVYYTDPFIVPAVVFEH